VQALNTAVAGLQLEPEDPVLRSVVDRLLSEAQSSAQRANTRASNAGAATLARKTFSEAVALEDEARRSKRKPTAIQSFWNAEGRFDLAAQQAANEQARLKQEADEAKKKKGDDQQQNKPPAEPPPAVNRMEQERARIEATLRRYEAAYDNLDAEAVKAVYPGAPSDLGRKFAGYEFYRLEMYCEKEKIELSADMAAATAPCRLGHYFKPKGAKEEQQRTRPVFTLQKRGETWIIVQQRF
jgi:ketosteroid isomerase-like protein